MNKLKWYNTKTTQPENNLLCVVKLKNGNFRFDRQYFGCWRNEKIIQWIDADSFLEYCKTKDIFS